MTKVLNRFRKAVSVAMERSTTTLSGVTIEVTRSGAVRVNPADVFKYPSTKGQVAAVRKIVSKTLRTKT